MSRTSCASPHICLVHLDTETTGNDLFLDQPWEVSFMIDAVCVDLRQIVYSSPLRTIWLQHQRRPSNWVLAHTEYTSHQKDCNTGSTVDIVIGEIISELVESFEFLPSPLSSDMVYLAGKNPSFDDTMLRRGLKRNQAGHQFLSSPWSHRFYDLGAITLGACRGVRIPDTQSCLRQWIGENVKFPENRIHRSREDVVQIRLGILRALDLRHPAPGKSSHAS